jgi:tRNA (guanine10-N2)-dimethyltransferase
MMVNLAIGQTEATEAVKILDPFCGSGTILMEAGVLGFNVIGSDLDPESATGSQNNLEWLRSEYNLDFKSQVFQKDATRLQLATKITHLVTEPFLGKPAPKSEQLPNIFRGLSKLYLGAFKQWTTLLADDASLVVVFPESEDPITKKRFSLEGLFDKLSILGYTEVSDALIYHRPNATIERAIHQFKFRRK